MSKETTTITWSELLQSAAWRGDDGAPARQFNPHCRTCAASPHSGMHDLPPATVEGARDTGMTIGGVPVYEAPADALGYRDGVILRTTHLHDSRDPIRDAFIAGYDACVQALRDVGWERQADEVGAMRDLVAAGAGHRSPRSEGKP